MSTRERVEGAMASTEHPGTREALRIIHGFAEKAGWTRGWVRSLAKESGQREAHISGLIGGHRNAGLRTLAALRSAAPVEAPSAGDEVEAIRLLSRLPDDALGRVHAWLSAKVQKE